MPTIINRREALKAGLAGLATALTPELVRAQAPQPIKPETGTSYPDVHIQAQAGQENSVTVVEEASLPLFLRFKVEQLPSSNEGGLILRVTFANFQQVENTADLEADKFPIQSLTLSLDQDAIVPTMVDTFEGSPLALPLQGFTPPDSSTEFEVRIIKRTSTRKDSAPEAYQLNVQQAGFALLIIPLSIYQNHQWYTPGPVQIEFGARPASDHNLTVDVSDIEINPL